jgi:hypothetical protein
MTNRRRAILAIHSARLPENALHCPALLRVCPPPASRAREQSPYKGSLNERFDQESRPRLFGWA